MPQPPESFGPAGGFSRWTHSGWSTGSGVDHLSSSSPPPPPPPPPHPPHPPMFPHQQPFGGGFPWFPGSMAGGPWDGGRHRSGGAREGEQSQVDGWMPGVDADLDFDSVSRDSTDTMRVDDPTPAESASENNASADGTNVDNNTTQIPFHPRSMGGPGGPGGPGSPADPCGPGGLFGPSGRFGPGGRRGRGSRGRGGHFGRGGRGGRGGFGGSFGGRHPRPPHPFHNVHGLPYRFSSNLAHHHAVHEFLRNAHRMQEFPDQEGENDNFVPPVDVFNTEKAFVLHVALPGAKKEDTHVNWDADRSLLSIAGVVSRPGDEELIGTLASAERKIGVFERDVRLPPEDLDCPDEVDGSGITAKMEDGILVVVVPKVEREWTTIRKVDIE